MSITAGLYCGLPIDNAIRLMPETDFMGYTTHIVSPGTAATTLTAWCSAQAA